MVIRTTHAYVPEKGDLVWLDFDPARGHEQKGHRPAFVVSPRAYNEKKGLALVCPVTSKQKGFSFETPVVGVVVGVILVDHIRNIDWKDRKVKFIESTPVATVEEVEAKLLTLISG